MIQQFVKFLEFTACMFLKLSLVIFPSSVSRFHHHHANQKQRKRPYKVHKHDVQNVYYQKTVEANLLQITSYQLGH